MALRITLLLHASANLKLESLEDVDSYRAKRLVIAEEHCFSFSSLLQTAQFIATRSGLLASGDDTDEEEEVEAVVFTDGGDGEVKQIVAHLVQALSPPLPIVSINNNNNNTTPYAARLQCGGKVGGHRVLCVRHLPLHKPVSSSASTSLVLFSLNNKRANLTDLKLLPKRDFYFTGGLHRVVVRQEWKLDGRGGTELGFGSAVYPAAVALAEYVSRLPPSMFAGKRVLELGCGTGICGITAGKVFAPPLMIRELVITDGDEQTVALAQRNLQLNQMTAAVGGWARAVKYMWGDALPNEEGGAPFDIVLACDVVAVPYREHLPALLRTFCMLKQQHHEQHNNEGGFQILLAYTPRHVCEQDFFHQLTANGFRTTRITDVHPDFADDAGTIQLFHIE